MFFNIRKYFNNAKTFHSKDNLQLMTDFIWETYPDTIFLLKKKSPFSLTFGQTNQAESNRSSSGEHS